jgi:hypothetical protein
MNKNKPTPNGQFASPFRPKVLSTKKKERLLQLIILIHHNINSQAKMNKLLLEQNYSLP